MKILCSWGTFILLLLQIGFRILDFLLIICCLFYYLYRQSDKEHGYLESSLLLNIYISACRHYMFPYN